MKENYSAWNVKIDDYYQLRSLQDRLKFLINFAVLAPSSHNSQPWKFSILENAITIMPDTDRLLPESDPHHRHLHIALGCALENILIAAAHYKLNSHTTFAEFGDKLFQIRVDLQDDTFCKANTESREVAHLINVICKRAMHRGRYQEREVSAAFLEKIRQWNRNGISVEVVSDNAKRREIAKIMMDFRERTFDNKEFRRELVLFKRTNFTRSHTGIPGFTMGFGNMFSLIAPWLIRYTNVIKIIRKSEEEVLCDHTPVFCIIGATGHSPQHWIEVGRTFQRIALEAVNEGMSTAISAVPHDSAELRAALNISAYPQIFFRLGYADNEPQHSPRLRAECVMA